jgi:hypothetical protein
MNFENEIVYVKNKEYVYVETTNEIQGSNQR